MNRIHSFVIQINLNFCVCVCVFYGNFIIQVKLVWKFLDFFCHEPIYIFCSRIFLLGELIQPTLSWNGR